MSDWAALSRELDAWQSAGRRATLWWRDDDAVGDTPALQRMLSIASARDVAIAVAAVPARSDASLAGAIARVRQATVIQHGYAHANHAPAGERGAELGEHRPLAARAL